MICCTLQHTNLAAWYAATTAQVCCIMWQRRYSTWILILSFAFGTVLWLFWIPCRSLICTGMGVAHVTFYAGT